METENVLNEVEYKVIEAFEKSNASTQREISNYAGISLGLTNIIIKRLVKKGFLKMKKLNKRKILYYLTPKSLIQKSIKTYSYIESTVKEVVLMKNKIQEAIKNRITEKHKEIIIVGKNEVSEITKWALYELKIKEININFLDNIESNFKDNSILIVNCIKNIKNKEWINVYSILY